MSFQCRLVLKTSDGMAASNGLLNIQLCVPDQAPNLDASLIEIDRMGFRPLLLPPSRINI